jgi:hypothetical protein
LAGAGKKFPATLDRERYARAVEALCREPTLVVVDGFVTL